MRGVMPITLLAALLAIATPVLGAWGMPEGTGERMDIINDIYGQVFIAGVIVFLFVMGWMIVNIVRFRPGGSGRRTDEAHRGSIKAELVWTIIPFLIVAWVGLISYDGLLALEETDPQTADVEIDVAGFQWFWQATYENGVTISAKPGPQGQLEAAEPFLIPADTRVMLNLTAGDVIHAMWIPDLGVKKDAVPGQSNYVWLEAPEGEYFSQCAEYCGLAHGYMRAQFKAVPMDEYQDWLDEKAAEQKSGGRLITVTDTGVEPTSLQAVANAPFEYLVFNQGTSTVSASFQNATTGPIAPGQTAWLNATAPGPGSYELDVAGTTVSVDILEPEVMGVSLSEWSIDPGQLELETGKGYLLNVTNTGTTLHNLYIGTPEEEAGSDDILWSTIDLDPGESVNLLVVPNEAGEFIEWCDVPGHYEQGMVGTVVIQ